MTPKNVIITIGAVLGVCTAIAAAWVQIGGPVPASVEYVVQSGDEIKKVMTRSFRKVEGVNKKQTEESAKWGRKIYTKEVHDLLVIPEPQGMEQKQYWKEQIDDAKRKQKFYENLEIELRKK